MTRLGETRELTRSGSPAHRLPRLFAAGLTFFPPFPEAERMSQALTQSYMHTFCMHVGPMKPEPRVGKDSGRERSDPEGISEGKQKGWMSLDM